MQGDQALALAALSFTVLNTIMNVARPFDGATKASTAIDPVTKDYCTVYRELVSAVVLGNLVAHCFSGSSATSTVTTLQTLSNAAGFVNSIESRALFHAGAFYFMYFLATGFPIDQVGPIAALAILTTTLTIAIFGAGSVVGTVMTEGTTVPQVISVPFMSSLTLALLILLVLAVVAWHYRRLQAR